ncbi:MAG: hypothetical protein L3J22_04795 [Xanthomonadales bacterium]|nr:hypothetical protein [Xanthomonadales bacterium]
MPFWQRALILVVAILVVSFLIDMIWQSIFGFVLPGYIIGVFSGLTAVPIWDMLKRLKLSQPE